MGKVLFWVVVILAIMVVIRIVAARNSAKRAAPTPPPSAAARKSGKGSAESMVRCAHCGVHLPRSDATMMNGKTWCGSEHAQLGER